MIGRSDQLGAGFTAAVGVYDSYLKAKATIKELQFSGFDIDRLPVVGKDYCSAAQLGGSGYNACDRMKPWYELESSWGGLSELLLGSAFYSLADIGPVIVFGALGSWIVRALDGGVQGDESGVLSAGLCGAGIAKSPIVEYETALKSNNFLLIAQG